MIDSCSGKAAKGGAAIAKFGKAGFKKGAIKKIVASGHDKKFAKVAVMGHDKAFKFASVIGAGAAGGKMAGVKAKKGFAAAGGAAGFKAGKKGFKKGFAAAGGAKGALKKGAFTKGAFKKGGAFGAKKGIKKVAGGGGFLG